MNTINITAGEMLGMNNDLYQICKRFIKNRLDDDESYTVIELQLDFVHFLKSYFDDWDVETDNKPLITTNRIYFLINKICFDVYLTTIDLSADVNLLKDELKYLLECLSEYFAFDKLEDNDNVLTDLYDNPQTLIELEIDPYYKEIV